MQYFVLRMSLPRGGCKHPVVASEKSPPRISPRVAALASGMVRMNERSGLMKKSLVKIVAFVLMAVMTVGLSSYYSSTSVRAETAASEQDAEGKRIYFAAPLFNEAEREYNLKLVTLLESYGYEVFLPQRDGFLAPELEGKTEEEKTEMIFQKDRDEVLKADILFMVLDGRVPDEGACVELGIAYANGKRCYGIKGDARSVELDMDLNPMITGCFTKLFYNLDNEELIKSLEAYLKDNDL